MNETGEGVTHEVGKVEKKEDAEKSAVSSSVIHSQYVVLVPGEVLEGKARLRYFPQQDLVDD